MIDFTHDGFARFLGAMGAATLRLLPAEAAHDVGMWLLQRNLLDYVPNPSLDHYLSGCRMTIPGVGEVPHPIGLAAGFDKQALCPGAFARMGFSFLELGTVTPKPQGGNPKPRLFRDASQMALVNRMGFNSDGASVVAKRIKALGWNYHNVPLGVNIGKNRDTHEDAAIDDYLSGIEVFSDLASYIVANVSSPNTAGLRDLANRDFVDMLAERRGYKVEKIWLKLDPDMPKKQLQILVEAIAKSGFAGIILTNTHRVVYPETGGQSGHPLAVQSTACLEWAWEVHKGALPMIATGGVLSGADVLQKIMRGACAVQVYSALVYRGPWVVAEMLTELVAEMRLRGFASLSDAVGTYYES